MPPFADRTDAGRQLAELLPAFRGDDVVVLCLPGRGVRVAAEVASALRVLIDVILVRSLVVARRPSVRYGILGEDGALIIDTAALARGAVRATERAHTERVQENILHRNASAYRGVRTRVALDNRTAILAHDCLTEPTVVRDACRIARLLGAIRIVIAVPVADHRSLGALAAYADNIVCPNRTTDPPTATHWYLGPDPTTRTDVANLLTALSSNHPRRQPIPLHRV
ncbi:phosphoribosyltransferase [Nocardia terpenica]|uniref:phosphoribosyltransferase n=1 Tax=Nocardia terpenica TaxID=455432 RepID=UPI00189621EC|nr:phosphoribosyltransferase [Nocardia terpenica]MBF6060426.1 phosphoribosyltransferase [Nocardia terpenica]MBF6103686.1 phosphoribosyltransferase [Nocardia terpenica]MBF6111940.1 phosphoribosyltransferase [Nocardia terpenica]MBF6117907.1 phosphoribosyltransferase [Nocardia terpenica]MBF6155367.1 phosphoribosyltransferase [Nocardia terpenica]